MKESRGVAAMTRVVLLVVLVACGCTRAPVPRQVETATNAQGPVTPGPGPETLPAPRVEPVPVVTYSPLDASQAYLAPDVVIRVRGDALVKVIDTGVLVQWSRYGLSDVSAVIPHDRARELAKASTGEKWSVVIEGLPFSARGSFWLEDVKVIEAKRRE
jgi:hypothetical protein